MASRLEALRQRLEESLETLEELIAEEEAEEYAYLDAYLLEDELTEVSLNGGPRAVPR